MCYNIRNGISPIFIPRKGIYMQDIISVQDHVTAVARAAKAASRAYAATSTDKKNALLLAMADRLLLDTEAILAANREDLDAAAENGVPGPMLDRLKLTEDRLAGIAAALRDVAALPDPIGSGEQITRPNGLVIRHVRAPLGCVAIIYEARPNVTVDAAALCLKTGNAVVLRGGKEAIRSSMALVTSMKAVLAEQGFSPDLIGLVTMTDRAGATTLMNLREYVDVLIPRGGKGLIRSVVENARVPVIETGAGNCHLYVDSAANLDTALSVAVNAKCSRPSVCNAIETLLVHKDIAPAFLPAMARPWRPSAWSSAAMRPLAPFFPTPSPPRRRTGPPSTMTIFWRCAWWRTLKRPLTTSPATPRVTARPSSPRASRPRIDSATVLTPRPST